MRHGSTSTRSWTSGARPAASDIPHTTDSGFNTSRLGHRLPSATALSHVRMTFTTLAVMHRAATPTISTKINSTALDLRLAAPLGVRRCRRDAHDSHCARSACGSGGSLDWLLDTRGGATTPTLTLSHFPRVDHCPSDRLARQRHGLLGGWTTARLHGLWAPPGSSTTHRQGQLRN